MYGLHQELLHERQQERLRRADRVRLGHQLAAASRWRRRAQRARQTADRFERRALAVEPSDPQYSASYDPYGSAKPGYQVSAMPR